MRILQINPHISEFTSTGKQVIGLHRYYQKKGYESFLAYSEKDNSFHNVFCYGVIFDKYFSAFLTRLFGNRYGRAYFSTTKLINYIKKINPNVVQIHCINCYDVNIYRLFSFLKTNNYRVIITEHAEFFHTGNCSHAYECKQFYNGCKKCPRLFFSTRCAFFYSVEKGWKKMRNAFDGFTNSTLVSVSPWLLNRTMNSKINNGIEKRCIYNGTDNSCFFYLNVECKRQALYITSNSASSNKGLNYIFKLASLLPDIDFIVVGLINKKIINGSKLSNVIFKGFVFDPEKMAAIYRESAVTIILSEVETFGMCVAESLMCGTPVAGFKCGGPESVAPLSCSKFVEYGNVDDLSKEIKNIVDIYAFNKRDIAEQAKKMYSFETIGEEYCRLIEREILK